MDCFYDFQSFVYERRIDVIDKHCGLCIFKSKFEKHTFVFYSKKPYIKPTLPTKSSDPEISLRPHGVYYSYIEFLIAYLCFSFSGATKNTNLSENLVTFY